MKRMCLSGAALCALFCLAARANAAYEFYVTIHGLKVQFAGEGTGAHKNALVGLNYHYELVSLRDPASGHPTGKRQHAPITITKEWGASSPQLLHACATNELLLSVTFEFYKAGPGGTQELYYTITLHNATISKIVQHAGGPGAGEPSTAKHTGGGDTHELEDISFTFQKITVEHKVGKTIFMDDWHQ